MSQFFCSGFGKLEVTPWYADNETVALEVKFSVPASLWPEFERSPLFQEINDYLNSQQTIHDSTA